MIQKLFSPSSWSANATDWASLILRLTLGLLMLSHGIPKLMKLLNGTMEFGDPIGIGVPASLTLTVFAEVFCSILIIIGFWTRLALIPLIITMAVAVFIVHINDDLGTMESALMYLLSYFALFLLGSGIYSMDAVLKRKAI
ncbi:DoxX family protein [Flavobacterium sp. LB2P84]|jgi:putative oxidoreductase|uniref:DoxX family protein n=1 Tax=Flavobacterium yafengii TaxID=3041253 RepID=UPI0024A90144|nr:DoxX family protein [Flavobacterium yafengii]MDI5899608.1 DoxX family protein [Flavobacterium yafengii]MDI6034729.1 DoxX family protein [Flavobacterium yafengii]